MLPLTFQPVLHQIAAFCAAQEVPAWLVGGTVRDLLLGRVPHDIDVALAADGLPLARALADRLGGAFVPLDSARGAARVVLPGPPPMTVDLVRLRAPTIEDDLRLRDFTLNALALPLSTAGVAALPGLPPAALIDPCGGLADAAARRLRPCLPTSLTDDPLRLLRAVRLAASLALHIAPELAAALRQHAALITEPAAERVHDELLRLLALPDASRWLRYLDELRLLTRLFPELEASRDCAQPIVHFLPVLGHMLETVTCAEWLLAGAAPVSPPVPLPAALAPYPDLPRALPYADQFAAHFAAPAGNGHPRVALFKLAVLLHDNAKPQTKQPKPGGGVSFHGHQTLGADVARQIARRLRLGRAQERYLDTVVRHHMRPGQLRRTEPLTPRARVRFFRDTGDAGLDVLLHALADHLAARGPLLDQADWQHHLDWTGAVLAAEWAQPPERRRPLLNGSDLINALGLSPGPHVGRLLAAIQEAQAAGELTTRAEALALAHRLYAGADEPGPSP